MCNLCCYCHMSRCHGAPPSRLDSATDHWLLFTPGPAWSQPPGTHWPWTRGAQLYSAPGAGHGSYESLDNTIYWLISLYHIYESICFLIIVKAYRYIVLYYIHHTNIYVESSFYQTRVYLPMSECGMWPGPGWEPDWVTDMISLMDYTRLLDSGAFINFMIENIYNKVEKNVICFSRPGGARDRQQRAFIS